MLVDIGSGLQRHCPSGRCGLKYEYRQEMAYAEESLSFGTVWIEILIVLMAFCTLAVTVLRDGVD